ncbi:DUF7144 family membrane protein [Nocardia transvalensis]|uniref:DUF7144 family membrane protein n=1 Tax=Nocardia transvalensis TaxID=37333 RepID=UPI001893A395|nr:hypothetical protein [Nocardia transvalensis]MBF6331487.1 hypothetical protein [Nocardia transvalensis]
MAHNSQSEHPMRFGIAAGVSIAAAVLLMTVGVLSILEGISAVADDDLLVLGSDYIYKLNTTGWGWIHIVLGILMIASAIGLLIGATWGRVAAMVFVAVSIVGNFLWLPYYPAWSILVIVLDVVVIWAIATWRAEAV